MAIQFYNTLSNRVELFESVTPGVVRMYNCGPTVYDYAHVGNFRAFLFADLLRRTLEFHGYRVEQVMNLTDVGHMTDDEQADGAGEDKMQVAARRLKESKKQGQAPVENPDDPYQVAAYYIDAFVEDARRLGVRVAEEYPGRMPRATEHVASMIRLIERLIAGGHAYVADDGVVYYAVESFPEYGRLSGNTLGSVVAGAGGRVEVSDQAAKRHPGDFFLWKPDASHLMKWPSPWGEGYPGWHIECSAMAMELLGVETLDIHTGAEDNIFPHHECEIAQSCGATGKPFVNYWLHARHLFVDGGKMSKSKGNFYTVRDVLSWGVEPAALRYEILKSPYRQNCNFTRKGLVDSDKAVSRLRQFAASHAEVGPATSPGMWDTGIERDFGAALADDLNISEALGALFKWMHATPNPTAEDVAALWRIDGVLDVLTPREADVTVDGLSDEQVEGRVADLSAARANKDYEASDAIRDELAAAGIEVRIGRAGATWKRTIRTDD